VSGSSCLYSALFIRSERPLVPCHDCSHCIRQPTNAEICSQLEAALDIGATSALADAGGFAVRLHQHRHGFWPALPKWSRARLRAWQSLQGRDATGSHGSIKSCAHLMTDPMALQRFTHELLLAEASPIPTFCASTTRRVQRRQFIPWRMSTARPHAGLGKEGRCRRARAQHHETARSGARCGPCSTLFTAT